MCEKSSWGQTHTGLGLLCRALQYIKPQMDGRSALGCLGGGGAAVQHIEALKQRPGRHLHAEITFGCCTINMENNNFEKIEK